VLLEAVPAGSPGAGGDCTELVNSYGQTADLCLDGATGQYSATFNLTPAAGSAQQVRLSTLGTGGLEVYRQMVNLLRPAE